MNDLKNVKIRFNNNKEFSKVTEKLLKLGFVWGGNGVIPNTAPYLYTYEDGTMLVDYFDVEGADLTSVNSAEGYYLSHSNSELLVSELLN